jgi:hypothetical protein
MNLPLPLPPATEITLKTIAGVTSRYGATVADICRVSKLPVLAADRALRTLRDAGMIDRPLAYTGTNKTGYLLTSTGRAWVVSNLQIEVKNERA